MWKVVGAFVVGASAESAITADGNPYIQDEGTCTGPACKCAAQAITPVTLLHGNFHPNSFQDEQLQNIDTVKAFGQVVPIYHFKQPQSLNPAQLPFKIALLNQNMPMENIYVWKTDSESATNSWFPEYEWSIVVCMKDGGRHLGWQFTNKVDPTKYFYALIVDYDEKEETTGIAQRIVHGLQVVGQPLVAIGLTLSQVKSAAGFQEL